jgi:Family of unknown function (DUF6376)
VARYPRGVRRVTTVLVTVVALVASGCGSDTKAANDYVDSVNKAQNDFAATFDKLSSKITSTSSAQQDRETLDGFKEAVDKVVVDLRSVKVPSKVKDLHAQLVSEISAYGKEIDKAKAAFAGDDPQAIVKAQTELVSAVTRVSAQINQTIDAINKKLRE